MKRIKKNKNKLRLSGLIIIMATLVNIISIYNIEAQSYFNLQGAGNLHTGTAAGDLWSVNNNQAGLAFYEAQIGAGFHYENRFMIKEMGISSGALTFKTSAGTLGLGLTSFGFSNFNTKKITLAFGKKFGNKLAGGVGLNYINIFQGNSYGSTGILTFDLGLLAKANDNFFIGFHVFNPIRAEIGDYYGEKIPVVINLGFQYKLDENLKFMADIMNDEMNQIKVAGMAEYKIIDMIYVRVGLITQNPLMFSFGAGMHLGDLHLDFSSSMHQILGYSPGFTLSYDINK
jgi:hypothetical protein